MEAAATKAAEARCSSGDLGKDGSGGGSICSSNSIVRVAQFIETTNSPGWAHHGCNVWVDRGVAPQLLQARFALAIVSRINKFLLNYRDKCVRAVVVCDKGTEITDEQVRLTYADSMAIFGQPCRLDTIPQSKRSSYKRRLHELDADEDHDCSGSALAALYTLSACGTPGSIDDDDAESMFSTDGSASAMSELVSCSSTLFLSPQHRATALAQPTITPFHCTYFAHLQLLRHRRRPQPFSNYSPSWVSF